MLSHAVLSDPATPWAGARQAPLSVGFSRQEYWSGLPFPPPGDLPDPRIKPGSPALQADSLPTELSGNRLDRKGLFQKGQLVLLGFLKEASQRFRSLRSSQEHGPLATLRWVTPSRGAPLPTGVLPRTQQACPPPAHARASGSGGPSLTGVLKLMNICSLPRKHTHVRKALLRVVSEAHPRLPRGRPPLWPGWYSVLGMLPFRPRAEPPPGALDGQSAC